MAKAAVVGAWECTATFCKYLTVAMNELNVVFTPVDDLQDGTYTQWEFIDGALFMDMNGTRRCFCYSNGQFVLAANVGAAACRLCEI